MPTSTQTCGVMYFDLFEEKDFPTTLYNSARSAGLSVWTSTMFQILAGRLEKNHGPVARNAFYRAELTKTHKFLIFGKVILTLEKV